MQYLIFSIEYAISGNKLIDFGSANLTNIFYELPLFKFGPLWGVQKHLGLSETKTKQKNFVKYD